MYRHFNVICGKIVGSVCKRIYPQAALVFLADISVTGLGSKRVNM
jgi:hypothetical protein